MQEKSLWNKIKPFVNNKYAITFIVFLVWVIFFDENSVISQMSLKSKLSKLEEQKEYYQEQIEINKKRLKELRTNKKNLEKFAREQYLMKKPNEDIFVIVEEEK
jgi:cell division protein FtsB